MNLPKDIKEFIVEQNLNIEWCLQLNRDGEVVEAENLLHSKLVWDNQAKLWSSLNDINLFDDFFPMEDDFMELPNLQTGSQFVSLYFFNYSEKVFLLVHNNTEKAESLKKAVQQNNENKLD